MNIAASPDHEWDFGFVFLLDSLTQPWPFASDLFVSFNAVSPQETSLGKAVDKQEGIQEKKKCRGSLLQGSVHN